ncbi:MAG: Glycosyl transferase, group 2 family protein [Candidatus Azambacteria bacterium GW2011_GWF2_46_32]|uniref:Glycosyl transferase, group 2 family protein n=3 Tax=Candidatus Azamiibacteriota TaxID=1752741 RepID=A0A0G1Q4J3_9BACT|nr:MAG: Glycosyl transferase, group 2 family protein [Candidatus Azambacteria bacterium GW2011_GWC1_46_13]KKU37033.1 MAG: Glycosyl transferase, group 2 family protein [Candidatus Azambacteria bacterium GW2011_GWF2_46_32]KKU39742.1 MAG: Glycosyl transferase, group 2 family protein [Candidatus Azambacteria bacterium GW2011_GWE2_46_45]HAM96145.1 hypothetical protein [Candidatus Azambacteria bacterium]HBA52790.1 hypothetical protein [Candidatus Azambacteria bacterium]
MQTDFLFLKDELSAKNLWQSSTNLIALTVLAGIAATAYLAYRYGIAGPAFALSLTAAGFYLGAILFRFLLFAFSLIQIRKNSAAKSIVQQCSDKELPVYTVLVPLRHEVKALPGLIEALNNLDWPEDRLEIFFLVDDDDDITQDALKKHVLPRHIQVMIIPTADALIRSKPRVLNAILFQVSGEFLTIYDAEDRPEQDQLKKAYLTFRDSPEEIVCVQARLDYYNERQNILTRWFTAEYASWFGYTLPALDCLGLPIPLGGTSNHLRVEFLQKIGGWDSYNVTEDCELGMRIYRMRGRMKIMSYLPHKQEEKGRPIRVFDSVTYEEATSQLKNWIRQRSRWIKGFLQTFIVHTRNPLKAVREFGVCGFAVFIFFTGGTAVIHLMNIVFWTLSIAWLFNWNFIYAFFPPALHQIHVFTLIFGNAFFVLIHVLSALIEKRFLTALFALFIPLYWLLMAIACLKAIWQLIFKPHFWEKTMHFGEIKKQEEVKNGMAVKKILIIVIVTLALAVCKNSADAANVSFPGSVWSELKTQASPLNNYGAMAEGVVEQGAELSDASLGKLRINFFGELKYSFSPNGPTWYNYTAPGIGIRLEYPGQKSFVRFGFKISQENWQDHDSNTAATGFITVYRGWNLSK